MKYYCRFIKTEKCKRLIDSNPKKALSIFWYIRFGKNIDWENVQTLNEKIQWLEAFTDTSKWTEYSDKYLVRNYIKKLGLEEHLPQLYGVWDKAEDIDFTKLPNSFAIKCNHDCGSTVIIKNKDKDLNKEDLIKHLNRCVSTPFGYEHCEPHYLKIKRCIIAEELLPLSNLNNVEFESTIDYKIWCINGKAEFGFICYDRTQDNVVFDAYDLYTWTRKPEKLANAYLNQNFKPIPKPLNLNLMIEIAEKLSKDFPQVRVDLYNINGKIYIGEMTFTSQGGRMDYWSNEFQLELGRKIDLPQKSK